ncbi:hypothetical protein GCM10009744_00100 [Kribbella alba]|uniref:Transposase DDE domain-containing protein n=1 Tax=Kribbella alba TaxID=190197 RepID=A0ABP4QP46_9ACTN
MVAADLIAWAQTTLLTGDLAKAEPKTLRYRLLHVAARITRGQRKLFVRITDHWPWRHELAAASARLAALPQPLRTREDQPPTIHHQGPRAAGTSKPATPPCPPTQQQHQQPKQPPDHTINALLKDRG